MKQICLFLFASLSLLSCNNDQDNCVYAYVGGEIINPNSEYLILNRNNGIVDTLLLDENNRFFKKIENLEAGVYNIIHGGEYKMLVLEPNDSLMIRLNTLDFHKSIVYTGIGAKKNNYLVELSLHNEQQNNKILDWSKDIPEEFSKKLHDHKHQRLEHLERFAVKYNTSPLFNKIAKATINYHYYANKEMYPFRYFGDYNIKKYKSLPEDFFHYRKAS